MGRGVRILGVLVLSVGLAAPGIFAEGVDSVRSVMTELQRFLIARRPTADDQAGTNTLSIELQPSDQAGPNLYALPRGAAVDFANYLFTVRKAFAETVVFCRAFAKSAPQDGFPHYRAAVALEALGRADEALPEYETSMRADPAIYTSFRLWGLYAFHRQDAPKAEAEWQRFQHLLLTEEAKVQSFRKTGLTQEAFQLGLYHLNQTRMFDPAMKEFEMVLKIDPDNEQVQLNLALSRFNKGIQTQREELFDAALGELRRLSAVAKEPRVQAVAADAVSRSKSIRQQAFGASR